MRCNWYDKNRRQIRKSSTNLSHMLWNMIKFSTANLNQIIFSRELFLFKGRISEIMEAFNICSLKKNGALEEAVKEKSILQKSL